MSFFERILVPVDFTINTQVALKKATELATAGMSVIYLFHVLPANMLAVGSANLIGNDADEKNAWTRLFRLKEDTEKEHAGVTVVAALKKSGNIENSLITYAKFINPSLIVIGKNNHHSFLPFLNTVSLRSLAEETGSAVLTVKPGAIKKKVGTVVMLVADYFPKKKIGLIETLSKKMPLNVHLVTILNSDQHPTDHSASALLQSMKLIRNQFQCNVQHCVIHSNNIPMAALRYAEKVEADMLLVNPESETTIAGWINKKDITDVLKPASALHILSIHSN